MRFSIGVLVLLTAVVATPFMFLASETSSFRATSDIHRKVLDRMCGSQCEGSVSETHLTGGWYMVERPLVRQSGTFTVIGGGRDGGLFFAGTPAYSPTAQQKTLDEVSLSLARRACGGSPGVVEAANALRRSRGGVPVEIRVFLRARTSLDPAKSCVVALTDEEDKVIVLSR